jgi:hypothetical protein
MWIYQVDALPASILGKCCSSQAPECWLFLGCGPQNRIVWRLVPHVSTGRRCAERDGDGWKNFKLEGRNEAGFKGSGQMNRRSKMCVVCGREMQWRKKWKNTWDRVKYCSDACRKNRLSEIEKQIERTIMDLLHSRGPASSICPSEAAQKVVGDRDEKKWRHLLESARMAARRLAHGGKINVMQAGKAVDPSHFKGGSSTILKTSSLPTI